MTLDEEELGLLEAAVAAWKLNRRSVEEEERCRAGLHGGMAGREHRAMRIRFRSWDFMFRYAENMNRLIDALAPRVAEGDLPPVSDAPLRNPDGRGCERDQNGEPLPPAWRVGECGEEEAR